ncbi:uncharacterized protein CBL_00749 [Carabus blaptoides fortunei]
MKRIPIILLSMGAYLSEPITHKISSDNDSERVRYGASSMQGWRVSQEDAHNCVIEFDKQTSLFAVYDGHGGHEVALYCSQKLPQFIKETEAYQKGDLKAALIDAFLGFDATIATREVVAILKEIAGDKDNDPVPSDIYSEDDEENVRNLYEEASMPIEQVMEKYQSSLVNPNLKKLQGDKLPVSPMLKARKACENSDVPSSSGCASASGSSSKASASSSVTESTAESSGESSQVKTDACNIVSSSEVSCSDTVSTSNGESVKAESNIDDLKHTSHSASTEIKSEETEIKGKIAKKESESGDSDSKQSVANGESTPENTIGPENGEISPSKGKGKAILKKNSKTEVPANTKNLRARNARQLYSKLLDFEEESDSEDDHDVTFEGAASNSSSEEGGDESSEGADDEDEGDEDGDDEDEEEEDTELYEDEDNEFTRNMTEEPGSDSGCTAVVALLRGNELYVANAGDSRCIVCRTGQAVDMSLDHKPEDEPEMARVIKAGGKVTQDGRVNGGLNLSRAIGDHAYKQNKELSDKEQMITALPDIKTLTINPTEDEFMVLACDGIWNFMTSQEVVDFVRPRLQESTGPEKLSQICEEMFEHCLAPHTMGDGTGCDNMTAIIVQFKNGILKRSASSDCSQEEESPETSKKRAKTDTTADD